MSLFPGRDEAAFAEVFAARAAGTLRTAYLLCGDWHRAEDLAQTAFARLYVAWPRLRDVGAVEAFLRRTLLNAYLDETRRAWRRAHPTEVLPERAAADGPSTDDRLVLVAARWPPSRPASGPAWSCASSRTARWSRPPPSCTAAPGR